MTDHNAEGGKNLVNLKRRDVDEVRAYFEGIAQGVAMACAHLNASNEETKELLTLVESHRNVFDIGWKG